MSNRIDKSERIIEGDIPGMVEWLENTLYAANDHDPDSIEVRISLKGKVNGPMIEAALESLSPEGRTIDGKVTVVVKLREGSTATLYQSAQQTMFADIGDHLQG